jgi:hypothetical protein
MQTRTIEIKVKDKRENVTTTIHVEQLSENIFRTIENELFFNSKLTLGTEFETQLNKDGMHEIVRIVKESEFTTRRFSLTSQFKESEYKLLGDEIMKAGGYWQVDFGSIATVNLPKDSKFDLDEILKVFDFKLTEITD